MFCKDNGAERVFRGAMDEMRRFGRFALEAFSAAIVLVTIFGLNTLGQIGPGASVPAPEAERFTPVTGLIVPWIDGGCHPSEHTNEPNCHNFTVRERAENGQVEILNKDGSIWFRFSVFSLDANHFLSASVKRDDFKPFSSPLSVILRITAESPNWFEVEVNEETRETKYVSKKGKLWAKVTWNYLLNGSPSLYIDGQKTKLRDGPDGKIIEETSNLEFSHLKFLRNEGDWALVYAFQNGRGFQGWVRWKEGRKLLVGCRFNDFKVPE